MARPAIQHPIASQTPKPRYAGWLLAAEERWKTIMTHTPSDPSVLSDPEIFTKLAYPSLPFISVQSERFSLNHDGCFAFQGRERFSEILNTVRAHMENSWSARVINMRGSMGTGKSHLAAALDCFLKKSGYRSVFIPDCRQFAENRVRTMQAALALAFADDRALASRFLACEQDDEAGLIDLVCNLPSDLKLDFILDQINALEPEDKNIPDDLKIAARNLLNGCSIGRCVVTTDSANHTYTAVTETSNCSEIELSFRDGLSAVEEDAFMRHRADRLPKGFIANSDAKSHFRDLSGCLPLFYKAILQIGSHQTYWEGLDGLLAQRPFKDIPEQLRIYAQKAFLDLGPDTLKFTKQTLEGCLRSRSCANGRSIVDSRYFYFDKGKGYAINGYVRQTMASILR